MTSEKAEQVFEVLLLAPLKALPAPPAGRRKVIVFDAVDEIPKGPHLDTMLRLLTTQMQRLPSWVCCFVTSRGESNIQRRSADLFYLNFTDNLFLTISSLSLLFRQFQPAGLGLHAG